MIRPSRFNAKLFLLLSVAFMLACDMSSILPAATPTRAHVPTPRIPGPVISLTAAAIAPSSAGWIAFAKERNVFLMHPDGSGLKQVSRAPVVSDPAAGKTAIQLRWSGDGQMLAFSGDGHIDVLNMTSLSLTRLVDDSAGGFDWGPNGHQLLYDGALQAGQQDEFSNSGLWIADADSGNRRLLVESKPDHPAMVAPLWSPDTTRVIFSDPDGAERGGTYLLEITSGKIIDLLPRGADGNCIWSTAEPIIGCLMADASRPEGFLVGLLDSNGAHTKDIPLPAGRFHPRLGPWSADGGKVVVSYSTASDGMQSMMDLLSLDTGEFKTLGPGVASSWSPDGRWILTDGSPAKGTTPALPLGVINTTSGQAVALLDGFSPAWQPGQLVPVWQPSEGQSIVPTVPAFCMNTMISFTKRTKGYYFVICSGSDHYELGPTEKGVYVMGPGGNFFVYATHSGMIYAARIGDRRFTELGNLKYFIMMRKGGDPRYQFRFFGDNPYSVQVTEQGYHENELLPIPKRLSAP